MEEENSGVERKRARVDTDDEGVSDDMEIETMVAPSFTEQQAKLQFDCLLIRISTMFKSCQSLYNDTDDMKLAVDTALIWLQQMPELAIRKHFMDNKDSLAVPPFVVFFYCQAPLRIIKQVFFLNPDPNMMSNIRHEQKTMLQDYCDNLSKDAAKDFIFFMCQYFPKVVVKCEAWGLLDLLYAISSSTDLSSLHNAIYKELKKGWRAHDYLYNMSLLSKCPEKILKLYKAKSEVDLNFKFPGFRSQICFETRDDDGYIVNLRDALFPDPSSGFFYGFVHAINKVPAETWSQRIKLLRLDISPSYVTDLEVEALREMLSTCQVQKICLTSKLIDCGLPTTVQILSEALERRDTPLQTLQLCDYDDSASKRDLGRLFSAKNGAETMNLTVPLLAAQWEPGFHILEACLTTLKITFLDNIITRHSIQNLSNIVAQLPRLNELVLASHSSSQQSPIDVSSSLRKLLLEASELKVVRINANSLVVDSPAEVYEALKQNESVHTFLVKQKDAIIAGKLLANILESSNRTLARTWINGKSPRTSFSWFAGLDIFQIPLQSESNCKICYYLSLDHFGRKKFVEPGLTKSSFLSLLENVKTTCRKDPNSSPAANELRYLFGLLLENPKSWAVW